MCRVHEWKSQWMHAWLKHFLHVKLIQIITFCLFVKRVSNINLTGKELIAMLI